MSALDDNLMDDAIRDQAISWLVRIQSDHATADDWAALTDWLEASEAHQVAFEAAEGAWEAVDASRDAIGAALAPPPAQIVALRRKASRRPSWWFPGMAAAACLAAGLLVGPGLWSAYQGAPAAYSTGLGESRSLALADGSQIRMDAQSTLSVRLGWRQRTLTLGQGEATFDVAKDAGRPFVVFVGDQKIHVVGTQFNIRHFDGTVVVTVKRGVVEVYQPDRSDQPIARLTKGWELRHTEGASQSVSAEVDPARAFAWTEGQMVCNDEPLSDIVADLNRRYAIPIRLSPAAAQRRFSGVLHLGEQAELVRDLSRYLNLSADRSAGQIILR
jgi:transmembrane sensor